CAVRELGTIPAPIPIHRVVTTRDAGDFRGAANLSDVIEQLLHVAECGLGQRVSPVQKSVNGDSLQAFALREIDEGEEVRVNRVDTTRADQAHQMQSATITF